MNKIMPGFRVQDSGEKNVQRSSLAAQHSAFGVRRSGATLLVTLGVLIVLSVMVTTFLLVSRHQSLSTKHFTDKTTARQMLDVALQRAMQFADDAMVASNYNAAAIDTSSATQRRTAPVGLWYNKTSYEQANTLLYNYQAQDILLVPATNIASSSAALAQSVNLLTSEACRLLPPTLTNRLIDTTGHPFRSGWITDGGHRYSFAVINCSGFIDAHCYSFNSSTQAILGAATHVDRAFFSRTDLLNAADFGDDDHTLDAVTTLSYDPGRDAIPLNLYPANNSTAPSLGHREFVITNKFGVNSITNFYEYVDDPPRLKASQQFEERWLRPVVDALEAANRASDNHQDQTLGDVQKVAWNIANYLTPSRVPVISYTGVSLASRADYGIEDVPLINEVQILKCADDSGQAVDPLFSRPLDKLTQTLENDLRTHGDKGTTYDYAPVVLSNVYATAVEVWYPFAPNPIPEDTRVFVGVYTNQSQVATTTNSNWSASDLANYYGLDNPSVAQLYLYELNDLYLHAMPPLTNTVFWSLIQNDPLVVSSIEAPSSFNETNLLPIASGLAMGFVGVYTETNGQIASVNPFTAVILHYAPASTNSPADYYSMASNYVPAVTAMLTNRVEDVWEVDGGNLASGMQTISQRSLPPTKTEVGAFGDLDNFAVGIGKDFEFDKYGFCVVKNTNTLICFPEYFYETTADGKSVAHVGLHPLDGLNGHFAWIRPLVAIKERKGEGKPENREYEAVDEALLTPEGTTIGVRRWTQPDSLSVDDPRSNAWASAWFAVDNTFGAPNKLSDPTLGPSEIPFIHADAPFQSIGEMGHITVDLAARASNHALRPGQPIRDTVDFSTRAGAATLDRLTASSTNAPLYGLIQANTTYRDAIRAILRDTPMGWTNGLETTDASATQHRFSLDDASGLDVVAVAWSNTLAKTSSYGFNWDTDVNGLPGWACFAEMLPDLSTNLTAHCGTVVDAFAVDGQSNDDYYRHDYVEDVMRGIVDKVSFRQNIFVVIVAAQTLSPLSTEQNPVVLADQRAAVTVIRDAFTGRWSIFNWTWLTE